MRTVVRQQIKCVSSRIPYMYVKGLRASAVDSSEFNARSGKQFVIVNETLSEWTIGFRMENRASNFWKGAKINEDWLRWSITDPNGEDSCRENRDALGARWSWWSWVMAGRRTESSTSSTELSQLQWETSAAEMLERTHGRTLYRCKRSALWWKNSRAQLEWEQSPLPWPRHMETPAEENEGTRATVWKTFRGKSVRRMFCSVAPLSTAMYITVEGRIIPFIIRIHRWGLDWRSITGRHSSALSGLLAFASSNASNISASSPNFILYCIRAFLLLLPWAQNAILINGGLQQLLARLLVKWTTRAVDGSWLKLAWLTASVSSEKEVFKVIWNTF